MTKNVHSIAMTVGGRESLGNVKSQLRHRLRRLASGARQCWAQGDIPWFRDIKIQARINILSAVVMLAAIVVGAVYAYGNSRIGAAIANQAEYQRIGQQANNIRSGALAMQMAANGLIGEKDAKLIGVFADQVRGVNTALGEIRSSPMASSLGTEIGDLDQGLSEVEGKFKTVTDTSLKLGLTEIQGLRGALRDSAKAIDTELGMWPTAEVLHTRMLRIRQAEKDFQIYHTQSFLGQSRKYVAEFDMALDSSPLGNSTREDLRGMAQKYSKDMAAYGETFLAQQTAVNDLRSAFAVLQPKIQNFALMALEGANQASRQQDSIRTQVGWLVAVIGALSLAAALLIGLVSGRSIARPVLEMEHTMNRLAGGELSIDIPGTHRADEVGLMAKAVRVFRDNALAMDELRVRQQAEQAAKELRSQKLENLIRSFDSDIGSIIRTVATSAVEAEKTAHGMGNFINETVVQMRSVGQSSSAATDNVQAMAAAAEQLSCSSAEIAARVNDASQISNRAAQAAATTDAIVNNLVAVTRKIDDVASFIQTISRQTHMLALNATIEAVRAGEHGHGFAVVANEVKQLAMQTSEATEQISAQIASVQGAGLEAVNAIEQIVSAVTQVNQISGSIAAAVEQQGGATKEIARSAQEAAERTASVSSSISWVVNGAETVQELAGTMRGASRDLTGQSEVLRAVVDNFLSGVQEGETLLKWGDNWLTGHSAIDADHERLVAIINELGEAMSRGQGRDIVAGILDNLARYAREHFSREEAIWAAGGLASLDDHRKDHAEFSARISTFASDYKSGRATLTLDVMAFLRDWLMHHVFKSDKGAAASLKA